MQTTVSDILLFQKCPYAWFARNYYKRVPKAVSAHLDFGTAVHKEVETLLTKEIVASYEIPHLREHRFEFENITKYYEVIAVEEPIALDLGGHTIMCRPDSIIRHRVTDQYWLGQVKTTGANKAHYIDYVRSSPHECIYSLAAEKEYSISIAGSIVIMVIVNKRKDPWVVTNVHTTAVTRTKGDVRAATNYVQRICDEMEKMILGENQEGWQVPQNCTDWTTGTKCEYFGHCHNNKDLFGADFTDTPNRYPNQPRGTDEGEPAASGPAQDTAGATEQAS